MQPEFKRRSFLWGIIATLLAAPYAIRHYWGRRKSLTSNGFEKEMEKYRSMVDVPVRPISGPDRFALTLAPVVGSDWKYVFFSPSEIHENLTSPSNGKADGFFVREGRLHVHRTDKNQVVLYGGDDLLKMHYPMAIGERKRNPSVLLVREHELYSAKIKGRNSGFGTDLQLPNLLTLKQLPAKPLSIGTKWTSSSGRVRPFRGYSTNYEVVGFDEILDRKTVRIRFGGTIADAAGLPGANDEKPEKGKVMRNIHYGHAWFDLETGLLVRQETEMETQDKKAGKTASLAVKSKFVVQLYPS